MAGFTRGVTSCPTGIRDMAGSRLHGTSVRSYALAAAPAPRGVHAVRSGYACELGEVCALGHRLALSIRSDGRVPCGLRARPGDLAKLGPFEPYMNMSHVRNGYDPVPVAQKTPRAPARLMGHRKKILAIGFKPRARSLAGNASMLPSSRKANAFSTSFGEA